MKEMTDRANLESTRPDVEEADGDAGLLAPIIELGLTKFLDPLRIPPVITVPTSPPHKLQTITLRNAEVQLHSQLPPTPVWTYNGSLPGPTIEVRSGQNVWVNWQNAITGSFPVSAVEVPVAQVRPPATAGPGRDGVEPRADVAALPPWTVVHLHGATTNARNDGWTENAALPGAAQLSEYPNKQRAATLWYHDHAMGITRLNVMTGLMGMYLIRDDEEDALHLPHGKREVPLMICDRNLDADAEGNLLPQLLYKLIVASNGIAVPFLGPFNLVNGVIWPHLKVDPCWYRFRVLNASNLRPYWLAVHDENGATVPGAMHLIGTDGGLLPKPVALDQLRLAPAERADVLIDFSAFRGKSLTLANTFPLSIPNAPPGSVPQLIPTTPNPDVMQFRVRSKQVDDDFELPGTISKSFVRLTHDSLPEEHVHRWVMLIQLNGGHPEMWEMNEIKAPPPGLPVDGIVQVQVQLPDGSTDVKTFQRASRSFRDAANFYVDLDGWEAWNFLNLSPAVHPMHIHLVAFQALKRVRYNVASFDRNVGGTSTPVTIVPATPATPAPVLDASDQGWKDTIRVGIPGLNTGELLTVAAQFSGGTGRYMYHCHIFEHEDDGMMSTFIVTPKEAMAVDPLHGPMHGHGHSHGMPDDGHS